MKRVVMIGPSPAARGGMATVIGTLLQQGYTKTGECEFIATHVDGSLAIKMRTAVQALARFAWLLVTGRVALLHAHVASGVSFWRKSLFIGLAHAFRRPVIFHLHGGEFRAFVDQRLPTWLRGLALALIRRSACGFALTGDVAEWLKRRVGMPRVEVFPNPVAARPVPREASLDVLFLGRIEEKKGVFDLIRGFAWVHEQVSAARLVLAGEGAVGEAEALAAALKIGDVVIFPGWVGEEARAHWLSRAAVFVLPSHHEQMPMAVLEAMAAGVPVVATRVGAVVDMLEDGRCGTVVEVGDVSGLGTATLKMLTDEKTARVLAERAQDRVRSVYSAEVVLTRLNQRYRELAA